MLFSRPLKKCQEEKQAAEGEREKKKISNSKRKCPSDVEYRRERNKFLEKTEERKKETMLQKQQQRKISPYATLYEQLIPKDHLLRKIKTLVDFSFIYEELKEKYCPDNGRNAIDPVQLFLYLVLKALYHMSDADLVERCRYDLSFKYFLGLDPEDGVIHSSTLTKFRKLRLADENILDLLIEKTVELALEKGVIQSKTILVDATHTRSCCNRKSIYELLTEQAKRLRKEAYRVKAEKKKDFPAKVCNGIIEDVQAYCGQLVEVVEQDEELMFHAPVREAAHVLREMVEDNKEYLKESADADAQVGHKTADTSFFGYKTHLAMTEERIITAATITSGEKGDGHELNALVEKSEHAGMTVATVIGDSAYSGYENLELAKAKKFQLVAKLNPNVTQGRRSKEAQFDYNKDADRYVCPAGQMAYRKKLTKSHSTSPNIVRTDFFRVEICQCCPLRDGCYKKGAKTKGYSTTILRGCHKKQYEFEQTEEFKRLAKSRYKIEAKNSELKCRHGYDVATSRGLIGMHLQGATTIFVVNIKRILKLMEA